MKVALITCAESVSIDQATNNLTMTNIIEELSAPAFPVAMPLSIVALFRKEKRERDKQTPQLTISVSGQSQPIFDAPFPIDFQGKPKSRGIGKIQTIVLPGPGTLLVTMMHKDKILGSWAIEVIQGSQQTTFAPLVQTQIPINPISGRPVRAAKSKKKKRR